MSEELVLKGETITPIHIGTSETINDFYIIKNGWRISTKKYMKELVKEVNINNEINYEKIKKHIERKVKEDDNADKIYKIDIKENVIKEGEIIPDSHKEFIKTYSTERKLIPFIPGSSIKGAIKGIFPSHKSDKINLEIKDIYFEKFNLYIVPYKNKLSKGETPTPIEVITNAKFNIIIKNLTSQYRTLRDILVEASKRYSFLYKIEKTLYPPQKEEKIEEINFINKNIFVLRIGFGKFRFYYNENERSKYAYLYTHKKLYQSKKPKYKKILLDGKEYPLGWIKLEISE